MGFREYYIRESISDFILLEKMFELDEDVNYILYNGFDTLLNQYKANPGPFYQDAVNKTPKRMLNIPTISSSDLPSISAQIANSYNPITIEFYSTGINRYLFRTGKMYLSLSGKYIEHFGQLGYKSPNATMDLIFDFERTMILSATHELTHWMSETFAKNNISRHKLLISQGKYDGRYTKIKDGVPVSYENDYYGYATDQEMNAIAHEIKHLKSFYNQSQWDSLEFTDLSYSFAIRDLIFAFREIPLKHRKLRWSSFMKRLKREGILGKNMEKYVP